MTGEEQLCSAIIFQTMKDYRAMARQLKKNPENPVAQAMYREMEGFLLSEWFQVLSSADGARILQQLRKEAGQ